MIHLAILGNIFPPVCLMPRSVLSNWTEKFPLGAKPQHGNHIIGRRGFGSLNFFILKNCNLKFLWVGKSSRKPGNCNGHHFFFFLLSQCLERKNLLLHQREQRPCSHCNGVKSTGMFCVALQPQSIQLLQEVDRTIQRGNRCLACLTFFFIFLRGGGSAHLLPRHTPLLLRQLRRDGVVTPKTSPGDSL